MPIKVAAGIDIGGTNTKFGLVDRQGNTLTSDKLKTAQFADQNFAQYMEAIHESIDSLLKNYTSPLELIGLGFGAPNGNFHTGTIEYAPNLPWKDIHSIKQEMQKHYDLPIIVTNDANAAALGEMKFGGAKKMKDFVMLTLGTGLGSGIIANGQLIYGHDGFAGEIGHSSFILDGRQCNCGNKGCFEAYVSSIGILHTAREMIDNYDGQTKLASIDSKELSVKHIHYAAKEGDQLAIEIFKNTGRSLGIKMAEIVSYLSPEAIFLFGGITKAWDFLYPHIEGELNQRVMKVFKNKVKVLASELSEQNAAILGASALVW